MPSYLKLKLKLKQALPPLFGACPSPKLARWIESHTADAAKTEHRAKSAALYPHYAAPTPWPRM